MDFRKSVFTFLGAIVFLFASFFHFWAFAQEDQDWVSLENKQERIQGLLDPYFDNVQTSIYRGQDVLNVDLTTVDRVLQDVFENPFTYSWEISGLEDVLSGPQLRTSFSQSGLRSIRFVLFEQQWPDQINVYEREFPVFVYGRSLPTIFLSRDDTLSLSAADQGVLLYSVADVENMDVFSSMNFLQGLRDYNSQVKGEISDYILVLGRHEEVSTFLSRLHQELSQESALPPLNFVVLSDDNPARFQKIYDNFFASKDWVSDFIVLNTSTDRILLEQTTLIDDLKSTLVTRGYEMHEINTQISHAPWYLPITGFIQNMSDAGFGTRDILIFLLIPCIITFVVFFKHFIGLGSIGVLLPTFLTIMVVKDGLSYTIVLYTIFFAFNVILASIFSGYYMLYAPRIAAVLIGNIILYIILLSVSMQFGWIQMSPADALYGIFFVFLLERTVGLLWSKTFHEYIYPFLNTLFFVLIVGAILSLSSVQSFLFLYPESIILLVFINIFFGRYKGLRVTEYFRFWEVIRRNNEEE